MKINENIKEARKNKNMTQTQLADELHVSRSLVARWEYGDVVPNIDYLEKMSLILDIPLENLLDEKDKVEIIKKQGKRIKFWKKFAVLFICIATCISTIFIIMFSLKKYGDPINNKEAEQVFLDILAKEYEIDFNNLNFNLKNQSEYLENNGKTNLIKKELIRENDKLYYFYYDRMLDKKIEYYVYIENEEYYCLDLVENKKEEISKDRYLTYFQDNDFNVCYATYRSLIYGEIFNVKPNTIFYSQGPGYLYGEWKSWNNDFLYEIEYSDYLLRKVVINYGLGKKNVTTLEFDNVKIEIPK